MERCSWRFHKELNQLQRSASHRSLPAARPSVSRAAAAFVRGAQDRTHMSAELEASAQRERELRKIVLTWLNRKGYTRAEEQFRKEADIAGASPTCSVPAHLRTRSGGRQTPSRVYFKATIHKCEMHSVPRLLWAETRC